MKETAGWYTCNLGDAMLAGNAVDEIRSRFEETYGSGRGKLSPAVFMRHESDGRLHCEIRIYFTPDAEHLAQACGASPCTRPPCNGLGLLAGDEHARRTWFPG